MLAKKTNIPILSFPFFLFFLLGIVLSCGGQQEGVFQTKTNSPPVISSVSISPSKPNKESELSLFIQSQDPAGDPVTFRYQWIKDDEEILGENTSTLKSGNFKRGDLIRVKVTPSDGKTDGNPFLSQPVKILNSPPVIQEVWIEPKVARVTDRLKARVKSPDPDGDSIDYLYKWEKNGIVLSGEDAGILEPNRFKKGDSITVTVTPNDGEASGKPKKSEAIIVANSPPVIVSSPPTQLSGNIYTYQVKAEEPINDPVLFTLRTAPKGMVINKETGLIQWEVSKGDRGDHLIEIEATDPEGAKSFQKFTLTIEFR